MTWILNMLHGSPYDLGKFQMVSRWWVYPWSIPWIPKNEIFGSHFLFGFRDFLCRHQETSFIITGRHLLKPQGICRDPLDSRNFNPDCARAGKAPGSMSMVFCNGATLSATMVNWLVVSNMNFIFHFIYGMSSFPLTFIFFKMLKTTNQ